MPPRNPRRPQMDKRFMSGEHHRTVSALQTPRQNQIFAALPSEDYERLLPHLHSVVLSAGSTVHSAGAPETDVYFITAGIVTKCFLLENGESAEFALVGNEGLIGIALVLGAGNTRSQALVTSPGHAYWLRGDVLTNEFERSSMLRHVLLGSSSSQKLVNSGTTRLWMGESVLIRMKAWLLQSSKLISVFFASGCDGAITTPGGKSIIRFCKHIINIGQHGFDI